MKKYVRPIAIAVCYSIAIKLNNLLLDKKLEDSIAIILSAIAAVVIEQILEILFIELPLHFGWMRRSIEEKAKFEGTWVFNLQDFQNRPNSVVSLIYSPNENTLHISGNGCCDTGEIGSKWNSTHVITDVAKRVIIYAYEGRTLDGTDNILSGFGFMKFDKNDDGTVTRGNGFFVDTGPKFSKCNYLFDRVDPQEMQALIQKRTLKGNEDISKLIIAYNRKHRAPIKRSCSHSELSMGK